MRLSEAIRLGSMLKPQGFGSSAMYQPDRSCVLGAAADAGGLTLYGIDGRYRELAERWPVLLTPTTCPDRTCAYSFSAVETNVRCVSWHLNDQHRWTREAIADWVQGIEETLAPATPRNAVDPCEGSDLQLPARV